MFLMFKCPHCSHLFEIKGYWKWILTNPFHWFGKRYTKCPHCGKRSWIKWYGMLRKDLE